MEGSHDEIQRDPEPMIRAVAGGDHGQMAAHRVPISACRYVAVEPSTQPCETEGLTDCDGGGAAVAPRPMSPRGHWRFR